MTLKRELASCFTFFQYSGRSVHKPTLLCRPAVRLCTSLTPARAAAIGALCITNTLPSPFHPTRDVPLLTSVTGLTLLLRTPPPAPPYPHSGQAWLYSSKLRDVEKLLEELKKMPYWERKGGRDHIFTLSHDQVCAAVLLGAQGERWLRSSSGHT